MRGHLIDLHCHTREHSYDGRIPAVQLVQQLRTLGFQGVVLTDHNYLWPDDELEELREEAGLPPDFLLLSGQEVRTMHNGLLMGDLLIYGVPRAYPDGTSPVDIFHDVADAGGFCTAPHPAVPLIGFGAHVAEFPLAAIEVWNGRHGEKANTAARQLAEEHGLPMVAGSDAHEEKDIGGAGVMFEEMPATLADIHRLIEARKGKVWTPQRSSSPREWLSRLRRGS